MLALTHQYVPHPRMGVRYLADYMAGSKRGERRILQLSKYRPLAKVIQHTEAQNAVSKFMRNENLGLDWLHREASSLRNRLADDDFDRHLFDTNADYITRFAGVFAGLNLPTAELLSPGKAGWINLSGVQVTVGLHLRLQRTTRTNKVKEGGAMLRYAKGKRVSDDAAAWQAAFLLGYLRDTSADQTVEPEGKLCLTIDAYSGICHQAPTNSISRYQNMQAACASISEQWPNIRPPSDAIIE